MYEGTKISVQVYRVGRIQQQLTIRVQAEQDTARRGWGKEYAIYVMYVNMYIFSLSPSLCVCVCVCMCVCVCVCVCVRVCKLLMCMSACMHEYMCIHV